MVWRLEGGGFYFIGRFIKGLVIFRRLGRFLFLLVSELVFFERGRKEGVLYGFVVSLFGREFWFFFY